ncbi:alpha-ketoglutarate-dependent dioxygenase AlkB [Aggregicoccus sp. 17bor-14]|uniref:alpha-ketoglutarate-dependent dioxygenase AlkB n=1 Tax=Myxococcaceae TaxID=31 RepID=UPI0012EF67CB|nr:alpha-ketoglutarate-dependent dioxygenase AlkB [Simulacricoccus sp. 17bor-14]MRI91610.1 alpha-ketoglutarate-dependent dioxygenase AlkB [Aggregicoccus sp. 17bor-14]
MSEHLPQGLRYVPDFLAPGEEAALLAQLEALPTQEIVMRGQVARRTTAHFGWVYGYEAWSLTPGPALPAFLEPVRARAAALVGLLPEALEETLVSRYPPGASIGWHRDAPMFGPEVVGVSLGAPARMRLRRARGGAGAGWDTYTLELPPRSAYVLGGEARSVWQHTLSPLKALRYSLSFRTLKRRPGETGRKFVLAPKLG